MNPLTKKGQVRLLFTELHNLPAECPKQDIMRIYEQALSLRQPSTYHPLLETLIGQLILRNVVSSFRAGAWNHVKDKYSATVLSYLKEAIDDGQYFHSLWLAIPVQFRTDAVLDACSEYTDMYKYLRRCYTRVTNPHPNSLNAKKVKLNRM